MFFLVWKEITHEIIRKYESTQLELSASLAFSPYTMDMHPGQTNLWSPLYTRSLTRSTYSTILSSSTRLNDSDAQASDEMTHLKQNRPTCQPHWFAITPSHTTGKSIFNRRASAGADLAANNLSSGRTTFASDVSTNIRTSRINFYSVLLVTILLYFFTAFTKTV